MKRATILTFYSPKTAGTSLVTLNSAILHQHLQMHKKVAILQLTAFPHIHLYAGIPSSHHIGELAPFIPTKEWSSPLLKKISAQQSCDIFQSPSFDEWKNISLEQFQKIFELIEGAYDFLYIDLNISIPHNIFSFVMEKSDMISLISCLDPISLQSLSQALQVLPKGKIHLIVNQCPTQDMTKVKQFLQKIDIDVLGILPQENTSVWHNVFEGFPVVYNKKSKLKKHLEVLIQKLVHMYG